MKRIAYAEEWLTTDDRVADLVLEYARALARNETADTVTIPVVDGSVVRNAQFLIGPASQIVVVDSDEGKPAAMDDGVGPAVAELEARLHRLQMPQPVAYDDDPPVELPED